MEIRTDVSESYEKWQNFLGKSATFMDKLGISDENINDIAKGMGDFLAKHVDPENPQQRVLKDLWDSGEEKERHVLAKLIIKMTKHHSKHAH